jgi:O-glycosyl hydrolase
VDASISIDHGTASNTVSSPSISTAAPNELLLAFVATDYLSGNNTTVQSVSGGGLSWALVSRANNARGTSEIWRAFAANPLSNIVVTATLSQSAASSMTVMSFVGTDITSGDGSSAIGSVASDGASSGAPSVSLTTTRANSVVIGVGNDFDNAIARTPSSGQSIIHQYLSPAGDTYWVQKQNSPIANAGSLVKISDTAPTGDQWNLSAVEILSGSSPVVPTYKISGTISPSSLGAGATVNLSGPATKSTLADSSGNFSFSVIANGTYTVTPSQQGVSFTPSSRSVVMNSADVTGVSFTATATQKPNLTIDLTRLNQTIDGMGVNINVNSWKNGQLKPALDALIDVNGSTEFRVIRDPMTWVTSESQIPALHNLDPVTLQTVYETPAMQDIWNTIGYLNQKGIKGNQIILNFMGWTPTWIGGSGKYGVASYITSGKEAEFATMVASLVYYGKKVKGIDFTYLSPLNEMDINCLEGPCAGTSQYATIMHDLAAELVFMGLPEVRFIAPDSAGDPSGYISAISRDSGVFSKTDHLTYHVYGSTSSPGTGYSGKNYWVTETGASCPSCDYSGSPSQGEWTFAKQTNDAVLDDISNGIGSVMIYDGYDSFYYHHNADGFWGLLSYDTNSGTYAKRKRFYVNSQLNQFIRPGMAVVDLTTSLGGLSHAVAVYNQTTGKMAIVGHNSSTSSVTINGQILNAPAGLSSMSLYETNSGSLNLQQQQSVPVTSGNFVITVPADTFFSLGN